MEHNTYTHAIGGKILTIELNNWAEQANGSVLVRLGETIVLATAVMNPTPRGGGDFLPLTVDYEEKYYATGKILGSRFIKRETRPSEEAILAMRMIDRAIRPRFDMRMRNEVQVILTILSIDEENDPDIPALIGASLALSLSNIPWSGPVGAVRVGRINGEFVLNPTCQERETSDLDAAIAGTQERINMLEVGAKEISEEDFATSLEWGFAHIKELIAFQERIIAAHAPSKAIIPLIEPSPLLRDLLRKEFSHSIEAALYQHDKKTRTEATTAIKTEWMVRAKEALPELFDTSASLHLFDEETNAIIHRRIIEKGERPDGRKVNEIRPLSASVGVLPRVHGSGLFLRGETHALSTLTLGAPGDEQIIEGMEIRTKKHFLHHYNFPPFSVGETRPLRGPGRREIGHGALVGKAILPVIPSRDAFPYTIRIVSEILSSNGSTSMASVCGATLALMDGGVPIAKPVAGAAMGLMVNEKGDYRVLTDLQGAEDYHGDMDFKVAGTRDGITAVQLDVKIDGLTMAMVRDTLREAHTARMQILDVMLAILPAPRASLSPWAPRVVILKINPEKIGALIGPGGKVINEIIQTTGVQIDIEDDGTVFITSVKEEGMEKALLIVKSITREIKAGELLEGKVTRIFDFGAMVEVGPRQEGLIHISELAPWHVQNVEDIVNVGDAIPVKVKNIDEQGRVNLSLKEVPDRYRQEDIAAHREQAPARYERSSRPHSAPRHHDHGRRHNR